MKFSIQFDGTKMSDFWFDLLIIIVPIIAFACVTCYLIARYLNPMD